MEIIKPKSWVLIVTSHLLINFTSCFNFGNNKMPINLGNHGNFNTSRVQKVLSGDRGKATHMGGWDSFKDFFRGIVGTSKQTRLNNLWDELHAGRDPSAENQNIQKFITFTKIKDLADNQHKPQFTANLQKTPLGFTATLTLKIGVQNILAPTNVSFLEHNVISKFIEDTGEIKEGTSEGTITQQQQQQQAATKIQAGVRWTQSRFAGKVANNYGFKSFDYQGPRGARKYLVSPNKAYFTTPNISIDNASLKNGQSGAYKKLSGADERSVILSSTDTSNTQNNKFTSFEVEAILLRNKIPNTVSHKINQNNFVARNAGTLNLVSYLSTEKKCTIVNLKNILQHVKSLHMDGYYHLDIKPENIQVKITQDNEPRLSLIDYDTLSSTEKLADLAGTPKYTTKPLHKKLFPSYYNEIKLSDVDQNTLQAYDEYALAITLMQVEGKSSNSAEVYRSGTHGISLNLQADQYIEENIKPEYRGRFQALITNPISYSQTYLAKEQTKVYLADMCK